MLAAPLQKHWSRLSRTANRNLEITDEGVVLGKTVLAHFMKGTLAIEGQRVAAMLSAAYSMPRAPEAIKTFHRAERCYKRGDKALAQMHLALAGLPPIDWEKAQRLFVADWAMNRGVTPAQLLKIAGVLHKDDSDDEEDDSEEDGEGSEDEENEDEENDDDSDFDAEHPRWPAGSPGGIGGEFAPKDAGDATGTLHDALTQDAQCIVISLKNDSLFSSFPRTRESPYHVTDCCSRDSCLRRNDDGEESGL